MFFATISTPIALSVRGAQVVGIFDLPSMEFSTVDISGQATRRGADASFHCGHVSSGLQLTLHKCCNARVMIHFRRARPHLFVEPALGRICVHDISVGRHAL